MAYLASQSSGGFGFPDINRGVEFRIYNIHQIPPIKYGYFVIEDNALVDRKIYFIPNQNVWAEFISKQKKMANNTWAPMCKGFKYLVFDNLSDYRDYLTNSCIIYPIK